MIHKANPNALNQYNQTPISYGNKILVNVMGLENAIALTERRDVVFDNRPLIDTVSHDQITKSLRNKDNWSEKSNSTLMLSVSKEDRKRLKTYSEASTAEWTFRTK